MFCCSLWNPIYFSYFVLYVFSILCLFTAFFYSLLSFCVAFIHSPIFILNLFTPVFSLYFFTRPLMSSNLRVVERHNDVNLCCSAAINKPATSPSPTLLAPPVLVDFSDIITMDDADATAVNENVSGASRSERVDQGWETGRAH